MSSCWLQAILPLACLALNVLVQIAAYRLTKVYITSILMGFMAGLAGLVFVEVQALPQPLSNDAWAICLANLLTFGALGYGYFHFLNLGETARRVRLLRELHEAGGTLSEAEILTRYNARMIVEVRVQRLLTSGQVVLHDGQYHIGKPMLLQVARILALLKRLLLGRNNF